MPSCVSWNSPDRKTSLEPTIVSSDGLLKLYVKFVSTRNSPVNALVSSGDSFVRGFPDSQVKSANAKGAAAGGSPAGPGTDWAATGIANNTAAAVQERYRRQFCPCVCMHRA